MKTKFEKSIDKAAILLNIPPEYDEYILFKIVPSNAGCCCLRCMPEMWNSIKKYIDKDEFGCDEYNHYIDKNEAEFLIEKDNVKVVLECHESGPELIVNGLSISLTTVSIIVTLVGIFASRKDKQSSHIKFRSIKRINGTEIEKEIDIESSSINNDTLKDFIEKAFKK